MILFDYELTLLDDCGLYDEVRDCLINISKSDGRFTFALIRNKSNKRLVDYVFTIYSSYSGSSLEHVIQGWSGSLNAASYKYNPNGVVRVLKPSFVNKNHFYVNYTEDTMVLDGGKFYSIDNIKEFMDKADNRFGYTFGYSPYTKTIVEINRVLDFDVISCGIENMMDESVRSTLIDVSKSNPGLIIGVGFEPVKFEFPRAVYFISGDYDFVLPNVLEEDLGNNIRVIEDDSLNKFCKENLSCSILLNNGKFFLIKNWKEMIRECTD